jgi:hypothetical protein
MNVNFVTARRLPHALVVVLLHVHPVHQVRMTTSDHTNSYSACEWVRLPLLSPRNSIIPSFKVLLHGKAVYLLRHLQLFKSFILKSSDCHVEWLEFNIC